MAHKTITLELTELGERIDALLSKRIGNISRAQVQIWLKEGLVTDEVTGEPIYQASLKLKRPVRVNVAVPVKQAFAPPAAEKRSEQLDIVYEDEYLLVVNKPRGLTVHPGAGQPSGTLVNLLLGHTDGKLSSVGEHERPGIVHRLDKDTSGLLMIAKTNQTHVALASSLQKREITRLYQALVYGLPQPLSGTIDRPISRDPKNRQRMAIIEGGKSAITHYTVTKAFGAEFSLVSCRLETGRTHQIRVHMTAIGHPLLGDKTYTGRVTRRIRQSSPALQESILALNGQALHAGELHFVHPVTNQEMVFTAELPPLFQNVLDSLKTIWAL
jgi:23S rRNA pseudouridine1911/1915/1917 synthase